MLRHSDAEVQFLVEVLESQRDQAVAQAAALFRESGKWQERIKSLEAQVADMQAKIDQRIIDS